MKTYLKYILLFLTLTILLIVSCSEEAPVNLTSTPIAHAGADQLVEIYDIVFLDGSLSTRHCRTYSEIFVVLSPTRVRKFEYKKPLPM